MGLRLAVWAASCRIQRAHTEPCLSVGEVGVNRPASAWLDWPVGPAGLREGGISKLPSASHGGNPSVDRLQGGWIPVRAPRLISVLGDDSGDMMAMG